MQLRILLIFCTLFALALPLKAQQKKVPKETAKPPAPKAKPVAAAPKEPEVFAWLLVTTDLDVNISVNFGKSHFVSANDQGLRIPLEKGDNLARISPVDGGNDGYSKNFPASTSGNILYEIRLKAKRDSIAAEEARKAEEVRKGREEEARKAEEVRKRREEEERKAEEERKKEERRKEEETRKAEEARLAEQKRMEEEARFPAMVKDPVVGNFVYVKSGKYMMGCTSEQANCGPDENPAHEITLDAFYLGETEVTQAQWQAVMGKNPSTFKCNDCPVENVHWIDIQDFISRLNSRSGNTRYRLPTEAEWEFAARGGNQSMNHTYAGSNNLDEVAWYNANAGKKAHPVKGKKPNELGLYDMSGNVWEWCSDWHVVYTPGSTINPVGAASGSARVVRGGSWGGGSGVCRVAKRASNEPEQRSPNLGFRLARNP